MGRLGINEYLYRFALLRVFGLRVQVKVIIALKVQFSLYRGVLLPVSWFCCKLTLLTTKS